REVEPDDGVGGADHQVSELLLVVAVDHPALRRLLHRVAHPRAKLVRGRLAPVRPVVECVELEVRHVEASGELLREGGLAAAARALDVDAPHPSAATTASR